jgi:hypothetical protein
MKRVLEIAGYIRRVCQIFLAKIFGWIDRIFCRGKTPENESPIDVDEEELEFKIKCPFHGWVLAVNEYGRPQVERDMRYYCPECGLLVGENENPRSRKKIRHEHKENN